MVGQNMHILLNNSFKTISMLQASLFFLQLWPAWKGTSVGSTMLWRIWQTPNSNSSLMITSFSINLFPLCSWLLEWLVTGLMEGASGEYCQAKLRLEHWALILQFINSYSHPVVAYSTKVASQYRGLQLHVKLVSELISNMYNLTY